MLCWFCPSASSSSSSLELPLLLKVEFILARFHSAMLTRDDSTNDGPIVSVVGFCSTQIFLLRWNCRNANFRVCTGLKIFLPCIYINIAVHPQLKTIKLDQIYSRRSGCSKFQQLDVEGSPTRSKLLIPLPTSCMCKERYENIIPCRVAPLA